MDDLLRIAILEDVPVLAYGIRTDFQTVAFPGSRRLLEIAHSLEELKTICRCGRKAMFNARLVDGVFVFDGDQVAIDTGPRDLRVALRRVLPRGERRHPEQRMAREGRLQLHRWPRPRLRLTPHDVCPRTERLRPCERGHTRRTGANADGASVMGWKTTRFASDLRL